MPDARIADATALAELVEAFHSLHETIFAVRDPGSAIEFVGWTVTVTCRLAEGAIGRVADPDTSATAGRSRSVFFPGHGRQDTPVFRLHDIAPDTDLPGPAIVETPFTTIVVDPPARFRRLANGGLAIIP